MQYIILGLKPHLLPISFLQGNSAMFALVILSAGIGFHCTFLCTIIARYFALSLIFNLMLCFIWWNADTLVRINGITKREQYFHILNTTLPDFVDESAYSEKEVTFQKDGDPKHTAKLLKDWLKNQKFQTMQ